MGAQPVTPVSSGTVGRWGLDESAGADMQGLVISPFEHAPEAAAMFLDLGAGGGAWLTALSQAGLVTSGAGQTPCCGAIGLTWIGLRRIGLPEGALASFPPPFQEGMTDTDRQRRLGDDDQAILYGGRLGWSGNVACDRHAQTPRGPAPVRTPATVHAILLLYGADRAAVDALVAKATDTITGHGVTPVFTLPLSLHSGAGDTTIPREHFGFADGLSQPLPQRDSATRDPLHGVPVGDVLIGYPDAHAETALAPVVSAMGQGAAALAPAGPDLASLGLNGTYMVVRQLYQDVAAFRASMAKSAAALNDASITADWVAARVIGRERDGDLLLPGGTLPAVAGQPDNAFGYFAKDRAGLGCPIGAHLRRANPRDGLAKDLASRGSILQAANNHRILRRARKYGAPLPQGAADDGVERGLLFMCLQTDIERQFEFVQQTWLLNPVFGTLMEETDPLLGPAGPFTLPADPLRRVAQVDTFVRLVGGEYFFLPSLRALAYLGSLTPP